MDAPYIICNVLIPFFEDFIHVDIKKKHTKNVGQMSPFLLMEKVLDVNFYNGFCTFLLCLVTQYKRKSWVRNKVDKRRGKINFKWMELSFINLPCTFFCIKGENHIIFWHDKLYSLHYNINVLQPNFLKYFLSNKKQKKTFCYLIWIVFLLFEKFIGL